MHTETEPVTGPDEWPERFSITEPAAVALLADLRALGYLSPFLSDAHTLSSAAAALERPTSTLAYWIRRFVDAGLLVHLGSEARAGMAMPRYRAPGRELVVPFGAFPMDRRVALLDGGRMKVLRQFLDGLDEAIERDATLSLGFSSDAPHAFKVDLVETETARAERGYTDAWMAMRLTADDARALSRDIEALVASYADRTQARGSRTRRHIFHAGITREPSIRWRSANDQVP